MVLVSSLPPSNLFTPKHTLTTPLINTYIYINPYTPRNSHKHTHTNVPTPNFYLTIFGREKFPLDTCGIKKKNWIHKIYSGSRMFQ